MDPDSERMTDEEARTVASRLSASLEDVKEPTVSSLAASLGLDVPKVSRELEILRHERRIEELLRERREEEKPPEQETESQREAFLRRQEMMYAWQHRGEEPAEEERPIARRPRLSPMVMVVFGLIVLFMLYQILSFSCAQGAVPRR